MPNTREYFFNINQDTSGNYSSEQLMPNLVEDQVIRYDATSGSTTNSTPTINLSVSSIVLNLLKEFQSLKDSDQKTLFLNIFLTLNKVLTKYYSQSYEISHLPPVHVVLVDDGSILIEWIFTDYRIAFSIETELSESRWYLLSNKKLEEISRYGLISNDNLELILNDIVKFVIENT